MERGFQKWKSFLESFRHLHSSEMLRSLVKNMLQFYMMLRNSRRVQTQSFNLKCFYIVHTEADWLIHPQKRQTVLAAAHGLLHHSICAGWMWLEKPGGNMTAFSQEGN